MAINDEAEMIEGVLQSMIDELNGGQDICNTDKEREEMKQTIQKYRDEILEIFS
jgi:C4-type Zn-finger protein